MKKTILALTLASVFAAPAFAMETENHDINGAVLETKINELGEKGYTRERNEDGSWMVKDASGETVARVQTTKTGLEVLSSDGVSLKKDVYNVYETNNDVIEDDTGEAQAEANRNAIENLEKDANKAAASAYKDAKIYARDTDKTLADHGKRIGNLEQDMKEMGNKMLVLEDRMDGVVASSHAITNSRPVLSQAGQYGVGVGMGAAGSKQAIAIGGAYRISDNWSGTMSVNYETKGKVSNDQLSAGVGAQYIF